MSLFTKDRTKCIFCDIKLNIVFITKSHTSFSPSIYRSNYDDLKNMSTFELEKHYITYGIHEHRMADKKINF